MITDACRGFRTPSGPEAQQLAIYTPWLLNGTPGGLVTGSLFELPGVLALLDLPALYIGLGETTAVTAVLSASVPLSWPSSAKRWSGSPTAAQ
jgi:chromate transport protein ChrA